MRERLARERFATSERHSNLESFPFMLTVSLTDLPTSGNPQSRAKHTTHGSGFNTSAMDSQR